MYGQLTGDVAKNCRSGRGGLAFAEAERASCRSHSRFCRFWAPGLKSIVPSPLRTAQRERIPIMAESMRSAPALNDSPETALGEAVQCVGPAVQRNPVRIFSSNRHSTARSGGAGAPGGRSVRTPSALAMIVVRLVAVASL